MNSEILRKIKELGNVRTGSALIELMDYYNVNNLSVINQEQAEYFYKLKTEGEEDD